MQLLSRSYSNVSIKITNTDCPSFGSARQVPQYRNKNENNTRPLHSFLHTSQQRRMCLQHGKNNNINKIHEFSAPLQVRNSRAPSRLIVDWVFRGNSRRNARGREEKLGDGMNYGEGRGWQAARGGSCFVAGTQETLCRVLNRRRFVNVEDTSPKGS